MVGPAVAISNAQDTPPVEGEDLPEIVVTASAIIASNHVDAFGSLATEVTARQLADLNAIDLSAALRRTPGVAVSRFNPVGSFGGAEGGAVYIRGMGASRPGSEIKTYIDGIPFYMGVWNHALLDLLPVQGMESITVYKGPSPQLFGNTFSAINLVPTRALQETTTADLKLAAGSFSTLTEHLNVVGRRGKVDYALSQAYARSDGHRSDADGRLASGLARLGYQLTPQWSVDFTFLHADNTASDPGRVGEPASKTGRYDTRGTLAALALRHETPRTAGRVQLYVNGGTGNATDHPEDPDAKSDFALSGLRMQERIWPWQGGYVATGLDVDRIDGASSLDGSTVFEGDVLTIISPHLSVSQTQPLSENWVVTPSVGVRGYHHSTLSNQVAPHAGLVLAYDEQLQVRATYARGYNYPGLDAAILNAIIPPLAMNNPTSWKALDPERLDHFEVGARYTLSTNVRSLSVNLSVFEDRYKNRYVFAFPPAVSSPGFTNLGAYEVRGVEASLQHQQAALSLFGGLTLLDPSRNDHPYAPDWSVALGAVWHYGALRVNADAQIQSAMYALSIERANADLSTEQVDGFGVLNMRMAYSSTKVGRRSEVFAALENVLDETYAYRPGYTMPGRSLQLGIQVGL